MLSIIFLLAMYMAPSLIAIIRHHRNSASIIVVNLFLGWTLVGWVVALAWSFTANTTSREFFY